MNLNSKFLRHAPCPSCGSRDNLGVYTDHVFCFGCHYFKKTKPTLEEYPVSENNNDKDSVSLPLGFDFGVSSNKGLEYLKEEGLTAHDVQRHRIGECPGMVVFPIPALYNPSTLKLSGWVARTIEGSGPKWLTRGYLSEFPYIICPPTLLAYDIEAGEYKVTHELRNKYLRPGFNPNTKLLVVVEDIISAIKIGRYINTMPLFGTYMNLERIMSIATNNLEPIIWLDYDKLPVAQRIANRLRQYVPSVKLIKTWSDPKTYTVEEIFEHVNRVL